MAGVVSQFLGLLGVTCGEIGFMELVEDACGSCLETHVGQGLTVLHLGRTTHKVDILMCRDMLSNPPLDLDTQEWVQAKAHVCDPCLTCLRGVRGQVEAVTGSKAFAPIERRLDP